MAKLSISNAWDETKAILASDGKLIAAVALALFVLPGIVLDVIMPAAPAGEMPPAGPWLVVAIAALLCSMVGQLAVIRLALGPHVSVGEAIAHGARRLLPFLGAGLLWVIPLMIAGAALWIPLSANPQNPSGGAALALLALAILGIFLAVRLLLMAAVASAERGGPVHILERAWHASAGNWWRLFGFLLLYAIGATVLIWAIGSVFGLVVRTLVGEISPGSVGGLIVAIVSQLVAAAVSVGFFVMCARIYSQAARDKAEVSVPSSGT